MLPRILDGSLTGCVAYTEPSGGSDLSRVRALALRSETGWVLDGVKSLVTGAHKADLCCTAVRTTAEGSARTSLSMFLVDMATPGVEVVRRATMNGWTLDEIHFHEVALTEADLLGEEGQGWRHMAESLAAERSGLFWLGFARHVLDLLVDHVLAGRSDGAPLADDPLVLDQVGALEAEYAAADRLARRTLWTAAQGDTDPSLPAMAKVVSTELLQRIAQAATEITGEAGLVWSPLFAGDGLPGAAAGGRFAWEYLERVHGTISVGANELQRDLIATAGLGLPRRSR